MARSISLSFACGPIVVVAAAICGKTDAAEPVVVEDRAASRSVDWSTPPDYRPADVQIAELTDIVAREIDAARAAGKNEQSAKWKKQLASLKRQRTGDYTPAKSDRAELHMVGVYEGDYIVEKGRERADGSRVRGSANVYVTHTASPVVLVLSSYDPVMWDVRVAKGVRLQKVIIGSCYGSDAAAPTNVPIVGARPAVAEGRTWCAYRKGDEQYQHAAIELLNATGMEIRTFIGDYAPMTREFVVGPYDERWRDEHLLHAFRDLASEATAERRAALIAELDKVRFEAPLFTGDARRGGVAASYGVFGVRGPFVTSMRPIPARCSRVVCDVASGEFYAIANHGLARFKFKAKAAALPDVENVELDVGLPDISHPCGLAFDTRRRRVLLATLGGVGHLYAYDVAGGKWSLLGDVGNRDLSALAYDAKNDVAIGIYTEYGKGTRLVKIGAKGDVVGELAVEPSIWPADSHMRGQSDFMHVEGDHAFVIRSPGEKPDVDETGRLTVVDTKTGRGVLEITQRLQEGLATGIGIRADDVDALRSEQARMRSEIERLSRDVQVVSDRIETLERDADKANDGDAPGKTPR